MDSETQKKVEEAVLEILRDADLESLSEHKVRAMAGDRLGLDLSLPARKAFVRDVVESFLTRSQQQQEEPEEQHKQSHQEEEEEEEEEDKKKKGKEYDDEGDLIICRLSNKRKVTLQEFRGKTLVSIREYFSKDGKELPTSKGISLTVEQWETFRSAVPAIEDAIKKLEGSD